MAVFVPDRLTIFREKTAICGCEQVPENTCYSWRKQPFRYWKSFLSPFSKYEPWPQPRTVSWERKPADGFWLFSKFSLARTQRL